MDRKLYKTIKQLIKLGIITTNTRVVKRRSKRNKNAKQNVYTQPTDHLKTTTNIIHHTTPTVQSEQAIINWKASELQLQQALKNKDLPDELRKKVVMQDMHLRILMIK